MDSEPIARQASRFIQISALVVSIFFMTVSIVLLVGSVVANDNREFLAAAGGTCAAGAGVFFSAWQYGQQDISQRSKFALDMAMEGVRRAYSIIDTPPPPTRIQWVNAGRVMARAVQTSQGIVLADHRDAWNQFREEWRIKFYGYLIRSPEFYLGLPEPEHFDPRNMAYSDQTIVDLLKKTVIKTKFSMSGLSASGTSNTYLSTSALKAIYDFAQYESDWKDPLDTVPGFTDDELRRLRNRDSPGLHVFLYAMRKFFTLGDSVKRYSELGTEASAADDDDGEAPG